MITRRRFIGAAAATGAAIAAGVVGADAESDSDHAHRVIERAFAADPDTTGSLGDIDHFVLLMQENRSFDHYFGTMSGVRGFDDSTSVFRQRVSAATDATLAPFHLDTRTDPSHDADIVNDPAHGWGVQHAVWNGGAMNRWMLHHEVTDGPAAAMIMGYFTRADIPVHYELADAFAVCDQYFCSAMGPTAPNRLYWMSATIDAAGAAGGPVPERASRLKPGALRWRTFPENLQDAGVSWKIYNHPRKSDNELTGMVQHFRAFQERSSALYRRGIDPRYPDDFLHDIETGSLPRVSWIIPSMQASEHPSYPPAFGASEIITVLSALSAKPDLWERTALIVSYDENGGFFDHVTPPTPLPGTSEEFLTWDGASTPIGLGFRVPCLVISPYTRGGLVSSQVYDHTSQLQLIGRRFGVEVPNLSDWRRSTTNDMTEMFDVLRRPALSVPQPRRIAQAADAAGDDDQSLIRAAFSGRRPAYPVPHYVPTRQERVPYRVPIR